MRRKRLSTFAIVLFAGLSVNAQVNSTQFTPAGLYNMAIDFPGLVDDYTAVDIDAFIPAKTPVETINVTRDANNIIATTSIDAKVPSGVDVYTANGTKTGNTYVYLVKKRIAGTMEDNMRENLYSNGTVFTDAVIESYSLQTSTYSNADSTHLTYDANNNVTGMAHYKWSGGAWTLDGTRSMTYTGTQRTTDTIYTNNSGNMLAVEYHAYTYASNVMDSVVYYRGSGSNFAVAEIYSFDANANGKVNVINGYGTGSVIQTVTTLKNGSANSVAQVAKNTQCSIYPVPASDVLNVNITAANYNNVHLRIVNMAGQAVNTTNILSANAQIDIANLANGTYIVRVENDGVSMLNQKLVVMH